MLFTDFQKSQHYGAYPKDFDDHESDQITQLADELMQGDYQPFSADNIIEFLCNTTDEAVKQSLVMLINRRASECINLRTECFLYWQDAAHLQAQKMIKENGESL